MKKCALSFARARPGRSVLWYVRYSAERETSFHGIFHRSFVFKNSIKLGMASRMASFVF